MHDLLVPRLLRLLPWVAGVLGILIDGTTAWRRRRNAGRPPATPAIG